MQPSRSGPDVLVGLDFPDDAGVYRLDAERALVQSVDFFTPVVDDPVDFGAIAATNALSDLYAMGAEPLTALNLVAFPEDLLPLWVLQDILRGSAEVLDRAGVVLLGGHSIDDAEPKFGLAVTGLVHPDRVIRTAGARPGDSLVLTKPIGVGVITTAAKRGMASEESLGAALAAMKELNDAAAQAMASVGVNAATDVTGFGLLGHMAEMADASNCTLEIDASRVPILPGAEDLASRDLFPGGSRSNLSYLVNRNAVEFCGDIPDHGRLLMADAVTSGGLLISVSEDREKCLLDALAYRGIRGYVIGRAVSRCDYLAVRVLADD